MGTGGAGCARTPACSGSGYDCGCQSPWSSIDPIDGSRRTHAQQEQRILGLGFSEPGGVHEDDGPKTYPFGQCRCGAFSTWDVVQHTFPAIEWYWILGVCKLLPQGPAGMEGSLDG